jgi:hypothetical protein
MLALAERAVASNQSYARLVPRGLHRAVGGRPDRAAAEIKKSVHLNPAIDWASKLLKIVTAHFFSDRVEQAVCNAGHRSSGNTPADALLGATEVQGSA